MVVFGNVSAANLPCQNGFFEALTSGSCELMGHSFKSPTSQALKTRTRKRSVGPLQVSVWFFYLEFSKFVYLMAKVLLYD